MIDFLPTLSAFLHKLQTKGKTTLVNKSIV